MLPILPELSSGQTSAYHAFAQLTEKSPESALKRVVCVLSRVDRNPDDAQIIIVPRDHMVASVSTAARAYAAHHVSMAFIDARRENGMPVPGLFVMRLADLTRESATEFTTPVVLFGDDTPPLIAIPQSSYRSLDPDLRTIRTHISPLP